VKIWPYITMFEIVCNIPFIKEIQENYYEPIVYNHVNFDTIYMY